MSLALGLISGTSMDGIDAALIDCAPGPGGHPELLGYRTFAYSRELRSALYELIALGGLEALARLDIAVGEAFAEAALALLEELSVDPAQVRCIGSHGQTLVHVPEPVTLAGWQVRSTLQIGEPAVIAARTGITTVADFRRMDMVLGGQGAPLVPLLEWRVFRHPTRGRVLLNLGGVANVTGLPPDCQMHEVLAFDTGPANVLLDAAARRRGVPNGYDHGGELAMTGKVDDRLLGSLLENAYYAVLPPKSADTGNFLAPLEAGAWPGEHELSSADLMATLVELTAVTVGAALARYVAPRQPIDEVLVSGGGVHNRALMRRLAAALAPATVAPISLDGGFGPDAKEAVAFALLGLETLDRRPGNLPSVTGAIQSAVLGKIVMPPTA